MREFPRKSNHFFYLGVQVYRLIGAEGKTPGYYITGREYQAFAGGDASPLATRAGGRNNMLVLHHVW